LDLSFRQKVLLAAGVVYLVGVWLHIPYGGGHLYSDIPTLFQERECTGTCLTIPYVNGFIEYPVLVSLFIYAMGLLGSSISGSILNNYYYLTVAFLAIPSLLLVDETLKISRMMKGDERRVLTRLVLTPTFIFVLLVNWYAIGVYLAILGLRKFMQGSRVASGILLGLSAATNLITAAPAAGMLLSLKKPGDWARFLAAAGATFLVINAPFIVYNLPLWNEFWTFHYNWYIEGSWMYAFLSPYSPFRHDLFAILLVALMGIVLVLSRRPLVNREAFLPWLTTAAFLFSTYVAPPQTNLMLLPFFAMMPIEKRYWEFLAFDTLNALVIVVGFSQPLLPLGITISLSQFGHYSIVEWFAILKSAWIGKFLIVDGLGGKTESRMNSSN